MRIEHLLEQDLNNSKQLLKESCDGLTTQQRTVVEGIYNELSPLLEVALTKDQIKSVFQDIEKNASAGGANRTLVGKGVDTARQVDAALNKLGKWLQDTAPVKSFDSKFEQLKARVGKKFPELDKKLTSMGAWAKANPGKTAAVIGILTTLAALAGGPVGGAIAGQILRGSAELLKGEKLSTAIGKGLKSAAFGYLTGALLDKVGEMLRHFTARFVPVNDGLVTGEFSYKYTSPGLKISETASGHFFKADADQLSKLHDVFNSATDAATKDDAWYKYVQLIDKCQGDAYIKAMAKAGADASKAALDNSALYQAVNGVTKTVSAAAQGAATASTDTKQESYYIQKRPLSEGQVYMLFNRIEQLNEGPTWDKIKSKVGKAAKSAAGAVAKGAQAVGHQLTTDITSAKLYASWKLEGSPTDSDQLAQFLTKYGVDANIVAQTYKGMKLPVPGKGNAQTLYSQVRKDITTLDKKGKQRLAQYLQKQLGTA